LHHNQYNWSAGDLPQHLTLSRVLSRTPFLGRSMTGNTISELQAKLATAAESLQKSDERATAGRLALEVMHEIRNPLEALGNLVYLTLRNADDPAEVRKYMHLAGEQMALVNQIASQTLAFARTSQSPRAVDLVGLAEAALRIHQRTITEKKVHLVKELPEGIVAEVHTGQMLQVISNVIVNALDALPEDGTLCLRMRKRDDEVQFVIADNGHGIPKEHCSEIFKPFFTTKEGNGTGLGLALSKNIVDRHRGKIRMRSSVRPGKSGTTFKISIPA
jgi:signal transduction histidine kinase